MRKEIRFFATIILVSVLGSINIGCVAHRDYSIRGSVIDSKTGKPIQGAAVVLINQVEEGSLGGASYHPGNAAEMTADLDGKFIFPGKRVWELGDKEITREIYIYEPNYQYIDYWNSSIGFYGLGGSSNVSVTQSKQGTVFEFKLSHLETESEKKKNVADIIILGDSAVAKEFPNFIKTVNAERRKYGISDIHIFD